MVSECPLAREHIIQGVEELDSSGKRNAITVAQHPIQILAQAYGIKQ
jgi:hypothetical protein